MFDRKFWSDATERAIKTAAQMLLSLFGADKFDILNIDWRGAIGVAGGAVLISYLMSLSTAQIRNAGTASLVVNPPTATTEAEAVINYEA